MLQVGKQRLQITGHQDVRRHFIAGFELLRIDDPAYTRPLLIGTTARELTTVEIRAAYGHRWPVETNFFVAQAVVPPRASAAIGTTNRNLRNILDPPG